jgi:hypothetical protein
MIAGEDKVLEAIVTELQRQSAERKDALSVDVQAERARIEGVVDLQALAAAVLGAVAGGP